MVLSLNCLAQDLVAKTEPRTPEEERKGFHLPPGFEMQLVASEPDINKPMNIAFDSRGRLWVTSTIEYPWPATNGAPRDAVKILSDFDENGRARKVTTFADGLNIPIGLLPSRDGNSALVHSIPNVWRLTDTDGDGKADKREVVFCCVGSKDTHGMTSSFTLGYDGWIYALHGFANDSTVKAADGSEITMNSGNSYRFREDGSHIEYWTHGQVNPFGLSFDPLGDLFSSDCHSRPIYMLLHGAYYPSFGKPHDGLGYGPEMCGHDHGSTGIAGVTYYAADQFPPEYRDTAFVCNPVTSRINHDKLERHGSTLIAVQQPDFVVSDDPWFRPVYTQLGPDGALYVTDFYNRIIGHYEVPLTHPGRDRERGRIWRIVYRGAPALKEFTKASVKELVQELANPNLAARMKAAEQLITRGAKDPVRAIMNPKNSSGPQRAHGLWILERLGALDDTTLAAAAKDSDSTVRVHAMRVLSERARLSVQTDALLLAGLKDADPFVQRAAADALGQHPAASHVKPLMELQNAVPADDTHLAHTLRMALRNQLRAPEAWTAMPASLLTNEQEARAMAEMAPGVPNAAAAAFLLAHVQRYSETGDKLNRFAHHIARYGDDKTVAALVELTRAKLEDKIAVLKELQDATQERGGKLSADALRLTDEVIRKLLWSSDDVPAWTHTPVPGMKTTANPWGIQIRPASDGQQTQVISSIMGGEQLTSILRSKPFTIPPKLSFFLCGHNGPPGQPDQKKNVIRLRAANSDEILAESFPPRNDTAQPVTWDLEKFAGKQGYIEAVDADTGTGFAWLAFGRLNPPVVPLPSWGSGGHMGQKIALEMATALRLENLEAPIARLLTNKDADAELRMAAAQALATAPERLQVSLAETVAGSGAGAEALLRLIEQGKASPRLLQSVTVKARVLAAKPAGVEQRVTALTKDLEPLSEHLQKMIEQRHTGFAKAKPDAAAGAAVFEKNCAVCHTLKGKGAKVGPQLDGVGVRGVERLLEDILDPNRNVDPAFRTSVLKLSDGRIVNGLLVREEGEVLVVFDDQRQEVRVPKKSVETRVQQSLSPMPATFAEQIPETDFYNLIAYLLEQREANPAVTNK